jgi:ribonuclease HI
LSAYGYALEDVTVNDAEYHGLLKGLVLMSERNAQDLVVVGDSRIVIQQVQGLINCNQPTLQRRLAEYEALKVKFKSIRLVHVKRDCNQAADYLTSKTLVLGKSWQVEDAEELKHLEQVSKIHEKLMKSDKSLNVHLEEVSVQDLPDATVLDVQLPGVESAPLPVVARVMSAVVTRSRAREQDAQREPMNPVEYQAERWRRIKAHQELDPRLNDLKKLLNDELDSFSRAQIRKLSKKADLYAVEVRGVLYRLSWSTRDRPRDMSDELRLVVPDGLRSDMLHYAHEDFQGGHQGVTRTFENLRSEFYWRSMYADVQRFVEECVDCASEKGRPPNAGPSPGNIEPRRPFEAVSMDFVTHMPRSVRGNTFWLLFQDMFSGYVMCKPIDYHNGSGCRRGLRGTGVQEFRCKFDDTT